MKRNTGKSDAARFQKSEEDGLSIHGNFPSLGIRNGYKTINNFSGTRVQGVSDFGSATRHHITLDASSNLYNWHIPR